MIYYDISVIYDSDSEYASRGFSYQFPAWTFENYADDMPGLGSFTFIAAAFAGSTVSLRGRCGRGPSMS